MPTTTTLLQAVNRLLLDIGERQVTSIQNPASRKAKAYLQDAFNDIQMFHQWEWLHGQSTLQNWNEDSATIDNVRRIKHLWYRDSDTVRPIPYVDKVTYETTWRGHHIGYADTDTATYPRVYTIVNEDTVRVTPYPTEATNQAKITADVVHYLQPPDDETDKFPFPERFMVPLYKRAGYMMAMRHLGDYNLASIFDQEFELIMNRYRTQENRQPTKGSNMFAREVYGI